MKRSFAALSLPMLIAFSCAGPNSDAPREMVFFAAAPELSEVHSCDDVVPWLVDAEGNRYEIPKGVDIIDAEGHPTDIRKIGFANAKFTVTCKGTSGRRLLEPSKIVVDKVDRDKRDVFYYLGLIVEFGERKFFHLVIDDVVQAPYFEAPSESCVPGEHLLAGVWTPWSEICDIQGIYTFEDEVLCYSVWWPERGPIIW